MKRIHIYIASLLAMGFTACEPTLSNEDIAPISSGSLDFSNYVAIGNSLTAGYADGGLYEYSQQRSFPAILAERFETVGGGDFSQPMVKGNGSGYLQFAGVTQTGLPILTPTTPDASFATTIPGQYNNTAIPGIRVLDIDVAGYATLNPYLGRIVSDPMQTYADYLNPIISNATFLTVWLGSNDALGYAASGGAEGVNGGEGFVNGLTPESVFKAKYEALMAQIGDKPTVIGTIPDVTVAPYFNTLAASLLGQSDQLPVFDAPTAANLNLIYQLAGYVKDTDMEEEKYNFFQEGANMPVFIEGVASQDPMVPSMARQLMINPQDFSGDKVLLPFGSEVEKIISEGLGYINQGNQAALQEFTMIATEAGTLKAQAEAMGAEAMAKGAEATQLGEQAAAKAAEAAELAAQGDMAGAAAAQQEAQTLGAQAQALGAEAQALGAEAQAIGAQAQAKILEAVPAAKQLANPVSSRFVLDVKEAAMLEDHIEKLNNVIRSNAGPNRVVFDAEAVFNKVVGGAYAKNGALGPQFITGGIFSLDGIHLTPKGYAVVAQEMVELINDAFGAEVPAVNVTDQPGVILP